MNQQGRETGSEDSQGRTESRDDVCHGRPSFRAGILDSMKEAVRCAADKVRRFSLVQLWGLWLLALALFLWILVRDWLV